MFKKIVIPIVLAGFLLGAVALRPLVSSAASWQTGEAITVTADQTINGNLVVIGNVIDVQGAVNGDLIAVGNTITVSGPVRGDVLAAGNAVRVSETVDGNVRALAGSLQLDDSIGRNVTAVAGTLIVTGPAKIGWSLMALAGSLQLRGTVMGDVEAKTARTIIGGEINGNTILTATEMPLIISDSAKIIGDLNYYGVAEAVISKGAMFEGTVKYSPLQKIVKTDFGVSQVLLIFGFWQLLCLLALWVSGLILVAFFGARLAKVTHQLKTKPWYALLLGAVWAVFLPVVLAILAGTVVGLPAAMIGAAFFAVALYLGQVFAGLTVGELILKSLKKKRKKTSLVWSMVLGVFLYRLLILIPFVGWVAMVLAGLWGFGGILLITKKFILNRGEKLS